MSLRRVRQRVINGYQHIMACRIARAWTLLVIVHFAVQVALQAVTLRDNQQAKHKTSLCLSLAQVPVGVPLMENGNLNLCNGIPGHHNVSCIFITSAKDSAPLSTLTSVAVNGFGDFDLDQVVNITVDGREHSITGRCAVSLEYMFDAFRNDTAEDIATICFQFWLLIVSLLAAIQDSIPHLAVCIASHLLDVGWAGFRIKSTIALRQEYYEYIVNGACAGEDMLGDWWNQRLAHAAPLFGTNVITLILLSALAVILFQCYVKINFCRMGASPSINRMYKIALSFTAFLQLGAFFTVLAVGMWMDLLSCNIVASLDGNVQSDQAGFFVLTAIFAPWVISGWYAIFREVKWAFVVFGVLHSFLLALWPGMLASAIFRYILKTWPFFACVSVTSYLFVIATAIMAVVCRLHFGKGLGHFLRVESELSSSGFPASFFTNDPSEKIRSDSPSSFDFSPMDPEKGRKGSMDSGDDGPMDISPYTLEVNKYSAHSLPFETPRDVSKTPVLVALPTTRTASAAIIKALNKGNEKALPVVRIEDDSRPSSCASYPDIDRLGHITPAANKERPSVRPLPQIHPQPHIRPLPQVHLQAPKKGTRFRRELTDSCSQAVVTHARKDPVVSATARTITVSTMPPARAPSPVDAVMPHENHPSIDLGTRPRLSPQPDVYGRI